MLSLADYLPTYQIFSARFIHGGSKSCVAFKIGIAIYMTRC